MRIISVLFLGFFMIGLCSCDSDIEGLPEPAEVNAPSWTVGIGFGSSSVEYGDAPDNVDDPCKYFTHGMKARTVTVDIYYINSSLQEVFIYPRQVFRDGINFNGIPQSLSVQVPSKGAFMMRVRVYGTDDNSCCPGQIPFYEQTWPYHENDFKTYAYIFFPSFQYCI